jgi:hypothetical protein
MGDRCVDIFTSIHLMPLAVAENVELRMVG